MRCPYFDESRIICDDGECECCEHYYDMLKAEKAAEKDDLTHVLKKIEEIASCMDNPPQGDWQNGCAYALGEIETLVKYLKEKKDEARDNERRV